MINIGDIMGNKGSALPKWLAIGVTCLGMIVLTSISLGKNSKQIEVNSVDISKLENYNDTNSAEHRDMTESINQIKIDVAVIREYIELQKNEK